jgi:bacillithiol system protein YtxJ
MHLLESSTDLDDAIRRSHARPVVIFKHSATCGTSAMAFEEVEDLMADAPTAEVFVVSIQFGRAVSNEIATRFGVRHESPQVLIIHQGVVAWHASHFRVTREEIATALATMTGSQRETPTGSQQRK